MKKKSKKSIIIIGSGIAGLSAGYYGQTSGYDTQIFEMHDIAGGLCTGWDREGFNINGGLHWLVGAGPNLSFYQIWNELGALQDREVIIPEEIMCIEGKDGQRFIMYSDLDRLEKHLMGIAPEDEKVFKELTKDLRVFSKHDMPVLKAPETYTAKEGLKLLFTFLPAMKIMDKWRSVTIRDFAQRFSNPFLREAIPNFWLPQLSMIFLFLTFAWTSMKAAGYPMGGPYDFARAIEKRYKEAGGNIRFNSEVKEIIIKDNQAVGVRLTNGEEFFADYVISAADGYTTIFKMLDGKYVPKKVKEYYGKLHPFPAPIHVALGVNKTFSDLKTRILGLNFPIKNTFRVGNEEVTRITALIYSFDSTVAPEGKTLIECLLHSDYDYWSKLNRDEGTYCKLKEEICENVARALEERFSGIVDNIIMRDVATPLTYQRYTGIWKAGYEGWMITPDTHKIKILKKLPRIKNFYMIGQWVEMGGGLPAAAVSGRNNIQLLCKKDKQVFMSKM